MVRPKISGSSNPNWKGGISKFRTADQLMEIGHVVREELRRRIKSQIQVDPTTECWNWTGSLFKCNGRACLTLGQNNHGAHRLAYVLCRGRVGVRKVLHTCDNVKCVNPKHLWLGTNLDNSQDMVAKGRQAYGSKNGAAKLDEDAVRYIRERVRSNGGKL